MKPKYRGKMVAISDESMGVSRILGHVRGLSQKVYADAEISQ